MRVGLGHRFAAAWVRVRAAFGDGYSCVSARQTTNLVVLGFGPPNGQGENEKSESRFRRSSFNAFAYWLLMRCKERLIGLSWSVCRVRLE
eukprot:scaffold32036_cov60-Phaeocystis_antarctica.AAC.3